MDKAETEGLALKPCPFCGCQAKLEYHNHSMTWSARCANWKCGSKTSCVEQGPVISAWNARVPSPGASLREALAYYADKKRYTSNSQVGDKTYRIVRDGISMGDGHYPVPDIMLDWGERARSALSTLPRDAEAGQ